MTEDNKQQKLSDSTKLAIAVDTLLSTGLSCPECGNVMEQIDTTYSNIKTDRCEVGQHTGDIYECKICEMVFIDNMLSGMLEPWFY